MDPGVSTGVSAVLSNPVVKAFQAAPCPRNATGPQCRLCSGFAQRLLVEEPSSLHAAEGDGVPRGVLPSVRDAFSDSIPDHINVVEGIEVHQIM